MKKIVIAFLSSFVLAACKDEWIPPSPPPPPLVVEDEQQDIAVVAKQPSVSSVEEQPPPPPIAKQPPPAPIEKLPPPPAPVRVEDSQPQQPRAFEGAYLSASGNYTIQVGVFPNESTAKNLVNKLGKNGIKAYYVKTNNPAMLMGSYYRVRIGYFNRRADATDYAESKLSPLGYEWWVDRAKNEQ